MQLYAWVYEYGNWYVHSGYREFPGQNPDDARRLCIYAYALANFMLSEATHIVCRTVPTNVNAEVERHLKRTTLMYLKRMYDAKLSTTVQM